MKNINFSDKKNPSAQELIALYLSTGWGSSSQYDEKLWRIAIKSTSRILTARDKKSNQLVGCLRLFSDNVNDTHIIDVVVHPDYQNKGIGSELVEMACDMYKHTAIYTSAFNQNQSFFKKCGFNDKSQYMTTFSMGKVA